ncbi:MAG: DNA-directed RNA polymerase subunit omega [Nitrospinae bacterium]|nr:DNA-directed RNA polymerase subunit omega [Nitrospinota bacterium]
MDYKTVRSQVEKKFANEFEMVTVIQERVRQLEESGREGIPKKGTDLIQYVMQEILDGKLTVTEDEALREV